MFHFQAMFYKLVKLVQVDIGKQLRGEIAYRQTLLVSPPPQRVCGKAVDNLVTQIQCLNILDSFGDDRFQSFMVDRTKELLDIAFQGVKAIFRC